MFGDSHYQYVLDDEDVSKLHELEQELEDSYNHCDADRARERVLEAIERSRNDELTFNALPPMLTPQPTSAHAPVSAHGEELTPAPVSVHGDKLTPVPVSVHSEKLTPAPVPARTEKLTPVPAVIPTPEINDEPIESPQQPPVQEPTTPLPPRRSQRSRRPPKYFHDEIHMAHALPSASHFDYLFSAIHCAYINSAQKTDPDTLTFYQAMKDKDKCIKAAETEIKELEDHNVWEAVPADEVKAKAIPVTWVFRRKRNPAGDIKRWKARDICLRGDLIEGSGDIYSPVVAFSTVRLFLIVSMILDWTCSIDFANAFVQATNPTTTYMKIPLGFRSSKRNTILKLLKSAISSSMSATVSAQIPQSSTKMMMKMLSLCHKHSSYRLWMNSSLVREWNKRLKNRRGARL